MLISFDLSGDFATFRKPDITATYLTYNTPPLPMIYGILGAIVGCGGYTKAYSAKKKKEEIGNEYPEFYELFKETYIGVEKLSNSHTKFSEPWNKFLLTFNNGNGYASKEDGGNLIITEQVLLLPTWKIYIETKNELLINNLKDKKTIFTPYLGKNEFTANITNFEILDKYEEIFVNELTTSSLCVFGENITEKELTDDFKPYSGDDNANNDNNEYNDVLNYCIFENYPVKLNAELKYELFLSVYTNYSIPGSKLIKNSKIVECKNKNIFLFNGS